MHSWFSIYLFFTWGNLFRMGSRPFAFPLKHSPKTLGLQSRILINAHHRFRKADEGFQENLMIMVQHGFRNLHPECMCISIPAWKMFCCGNIYSKARVNSTWACLHCLHKLSPKVGQFPFGSRERQPHQSGCLSKNYTHEQGMPSAQIGTPSKVLFLRVPLFLWRLTGNQQDNDTILVGAP